MMSKRSYYWLSGIVFIFFFLGITLPYNFFSCRCKAEIFRVEKGDKLKEISKKLEEKGIIRSAIFFETYIILTDSSKGLKAGDYYFSPNMSVYEISEIIKEGEDSVFKVTIPEGFNIFQIEKAMGEAAGREVILRDLKVGDFKDQFDFLEDVPNDHSLEGFLFPDTYQIPSFEAKEIASLMLFNFGKKVTPELREKLVLQKKSVFDVVIMASMIEKEVREKKDMELVSGILWKRLSIQMPLQVDATVNYALNKQGTVLKSDLQIDSPYNTYKFYGLPKGPISNPGIDSIKAVISPKESNYWYYLSAKTGETIFSRNLDEHNLARAKYLR